MTYTKQSFVKKCMFIVLFCTSLTPCFASELTKRKEPCRVALREIVKKVYEIEIPNDIEEIIFGHIEKPTFFLKVHFIAPYTLNDPDSTDGDKIFHNPRLEDNEFIHTYIITPLPYRNTILLDCYFYNRGMHRDGNFQDIESQEIKIPRTVSSYIPDLTPDNQVDYEKLCCLVVLAKYFGIRVIHWSEKMPDFNGGIRYVEKEYTRYQRHPFFDDIASGKPITNQESPANNEAMKTAIQLDCSIKPRSFAVCFKRELAFARERANNRITSFSLGLHHIVFNLYLGYAWMGCALIVFTTTANIQKIKKLRLAGSTLDFEYVSIDQEVSYYTVLSRAKNFFVLFFVFHLIYGNLLYLLGLRFIGFGKIPHRCVWVYLCNLFGLYVIYIVERIRWWNIGG